MCKDEDSDEEAAPEAWDNEDMASVTSETATGEELLAAGHSTSGSEASADLECMPPAAGDGEGDAADPLSTTHGEPALQMQCSVGEREHCKSGVQRSASCGFSPQQSLGALSGALSGGSSVWGCPSPRGKLREQRAQRKQSYTLLLSAA